MNKNLVIGLGILVVVLGIIIYVQQSHKPAVSPENTQRVTTTEESIPQLQDAVVYDPLTPKDKYTLKNGQGELQQPDGPSVGFIKLGNKSTKIESGIITTVAYNYGGSGVFVYLASFEAAQGPYQMSSDQSLGDRVRVDSITSEGNAVTVVYYDFGPNQAMADNPDVRIEKTFTYSDGKLTPIK